MAVIVDGGDNGASCYVLVDVQAGTVYTAPGDDVAARNAIIERTYPPCPAGTPKPPPVNPITLVDQFLATHPLPTPAPTVPPGYAITGKLAFLIAGDTNHPKPWDRATILGPLHVTATATLTVNWGDGTPAAGPYAGTGAPWPSGTITHTYDDIGHYTITAVQHWTIHWAIGPTAGTINDVTTTGRIPGYAVRQIQAVITG